MTRQDAKSRAARIWGLAGHALYRKSGTLRYEVGFCARDKFTTVGRGVTWELAFADAEIRCPTGGMSA